METPLIIAIFCAICFAIMMVLEHLEDKREEKRREEIGREIWRLRRSLPEEDRNSDAFTMHTSSAEEEE